MQTTSTETRTRYARSADGVEGTDNVALSDDSRVLGCDSCDTGMRGAHCKRKGMQELQKKVLEARSRSGASQGRVAAPRVLASRAAPVGAWAKPRVGGAAPPQAATLVDTVVRAWTRFVESAGGYKSLVTTTVAMCIGFYVARLGAGCAFHPLRRELLTRCTHRLHACALRGRGRVGPMSCRVENPIMRVAAMGRSDGVAPGSQSAYHGTPDHTIPPEALLWR
jgi:hypothetical protein